MSRTIIHKVPASGSIETAAEIQNAWRGAMAIWKTLYRRYIADPTVPSSLADGMMLMGDMQPVWDLAKRKDIPEAFRITLMTTFDHVMVERRYLRLVIDAFREFDRAFGGDTSLHEQSAVLQQLSTDETCFAACWTQTSVAGDVWLVPEGDDMRWYDVSRDTGHWFMFGGQS